MAQDSAQVDQSSLCLSQILVRILRKQTYQISIEQLIMSEIFIQPIINDIELTHIYLKLSNLRKMLREFFLTKSYPLYSISLLILSSRSYWPLF